MMYGCDCDDAQILLVECAARGHPTHALAVQEQQPPWHSSVYWRLEVAELRSVLLRLQKRARAYERALERIASFGTPTLGPGDEAMIAQRVLAEQAPRTQGAGGQEPPKEGAG